jgi:hypothetical protein
MTTPSSLVRDASITSLSGASEALFPAVAWGSIVERFVHNPNATHAIAINLTGGTAALNTGGSITIPALGSWSGAVCNAITVIGTAGEDVTAGER